MLNIQGPHLKEGFTCFPPRIFGVDVVTILLSVEANLHVLCAIEANLNQNVYSRCYLPFIIIFSFQLIEPILREDVTCTINLYDISETTYSRILVVEPTLMIICPFKGESMYSLLKHYFASELAMIVPWKLFPKLHCVSHMSTMNCLDSNCRRFDPSWQINLNWVFILISSQLVFLTNTCRDPLQLLSLIQLKITKAFILLNYYFYKLYLWIDVVMCK